MKHQPNINRWLFGVHKAGTVLLNNLASCMANTAGIERVNIASSQFNAGRPEDELPKGDSADKYLNPEGLLLHGFRLRPKWVPNNLNSGHVGLLVLRDPRDVLVSFFHSVANTHPAPEDPAARAAFFANREAARKKGLETWAEENAHLIETRWCAWDTMTWPKRTTYENIVLGLGNRLPEFLAKSLLIPLSGPMAAALGKKVLPAKAAGKENNNSHFRSGRSKQWVDEFDPKTAERLEKAMPTALRMWKEAEQSGS